MPRIYIDGDACPVKDEVYRVAKRYEVPVTVVAEAWMRTPESDSIELVVVKSDFDAADDWIVEHVSDDDLVITADILMADRCLKTGARVLGHRGREFTPESIGEAMARRELSAELREMGIQTGGPKPFDKRDRSQFLQALDVILTAMT
jgi:uncharacterized protein YaiI (UPF0178 family)